MAEKSAGVIAKPRPRLTDLFKQGELVEFTDGEVTVKVWLQKLNQQETKQAAEAARPYKSMVNAIKRLPDDDPKKLAYSDQLDSAGLTEKSQFIEFLIRDKMQEAWLSAEAEISSKDEWAKDEYLQGLQDIWLESMEERYLADPEGDEEAVQVFKELFRYTEQVNSEINHAHEELVNEIDDLPYEELRSRVVNKLIEEYSDKVMIDEFKIQQLYLATRNPDNHDELYFDNKDQILSLSDSVYNKLSSTYSDMSVDGIEGKD